jgi:hypothetical protein
MLRRIASASFGILFVAIAGMNVWLMPGDQSLFSDTVVVRESPPGNKNNWLSVLEFVTFANAERKRSYP